MAEAFAFAVRDLLVVTASVADAWTRGLDADWTAQAGTLEWSCARTAAHAVDTLVAPAFFLASRRTDRYPSGGWSSDEPTSPEELVEGVETGGQLLAAVVAGTPPDVRALLFQRPPTLGTPADFAPRGALELIIHAHDVCAGLGVEFDPPRDACENLRRHVSGWPFWGSYWPALSMKGDPWLDLLRASQRLSEPPG